MRQKRVTVPAVESRLGWEPGRLEGLLEGQARLGFDELLEVLPVLDITPGEFFAGLYGFEPRDSGTAVGEMIAETTRDSANGFRQRVLDRRFEESRKVVREAVARRMAWKQQRAELGEKVSPAARREPTGEPRKSD